MSFHYRQIVAMYGGCSVLVASGPAATGKITAIKAGLSLFGCSNNNVCQMNKQGLSRKILDFHSSLRN